MDQRAEPDDEPPREFDDYVIVHELGRGQMGRVYLAEDAVLARSVAIKFIAGVEPDVAARQRFLMEARAAARIQHPNVVGIYRVGELGDRPYIVSELVRGKSLADHELPMPWTQVLGIAIELARGLAAAHRRGVVHCDIKPENAMITDEGVAKLVDFGLARVVHEGSHDSHDDAVGTMVGTPDYMAPEVWAGRAPSRRSDVYSFGAVLYALIAGLAPFGDLGPDELGTAVRARPAPDLQQRVPEVDVRLARLIARCLERDPELRFASGEELRGALEQLQPSRSQVADPVDENPYRGLRTFEASHRGLFFGRELEVGEIVDRLRTESIVIVTGDSGVGKSSLLRAGVVPAVLDGALGGGRSWQSITMVPGRRPLLALATALGDPSMVERVLADPEALPRELHRRAGSGGVLLFVDQMEELVTVGDRAEVAALDAGLARISEGIAGVRLVTTVRADFLSRIATLPRLGRELARLLVFVSPLPPDRLRDVITGPASATGVQFESEAMIAELVDATARAGSGGLPLLSFALAELWEARDREHGAITQAALAAMGGVAGALARHGDSVLAGMPAAERGNIRRVLLRLVTSVGTRVRRTESEISVGEGTNRALATLVKGRLLVVHEGETGATYELAHEVLIHGWGTLREWLDADADDRARRERLALATAEWQRAGRRADLTWRGPRLVEARTLESASLTVHEREFVLASIRAELRRTWLWRGAIAIAAVALVLVYVVQRYVTQQRLADAVALEVDAARASHEQARTADREQQTAAPRAFARFDAADDRGGEALWAQILDQRRVADTAYRTAGARVEAALAKDPTRDDVRALLGDILFERALLADATHDTSRRDDLLTRLASYDADGSRRARWSAPGRLVVRAPGAEITLEPEHRVLGAGAAEVGLEPGSYVVELHAAGREPVRAPVAVERAGRVELAFTLPPAGSVPAGFVYIPPGTFLYGSKNEEGMRLGYFQTAPMHPRTTGAYLIGRTEVTVEDWLAFIAAQPEAEQAALLPNIPTSATGTYVIDRDRGTWRLALRTLQHAYSARWGEPIVYTGRTTHVRQDWRRFPVTAISVELAERYTAWLDRSGRVPGARLCTDVEWERAGRGADGRDYPQGDRLAPAEANYDLTYNRELMGPDEVASHPASTGPFGLADMSGNAFEWTRAARAGEYIVRGGSYFHDGKTATLVNRAVVSREFLDVSVGLRVCATAPQAATPSID
jgi:formylglycine-generating enzyme required for sulfatase activity